MLHRRGFEVEFVSQSVNTRAVNYSKKSSETMQLIFSRRTSISCYSDLKGVEMETTFALFKMFAAIKFSFVLNVAFPGRRKHCCRRFSSKLKPYVNWTDCSFSIFEKKNVTRIDVALGSHRVWRYWCDVFLVESGWLIKISRTIFFFFFFAVDVFGDEILHV